MKYRPGYPRQPFADLAAAHAWVTGFATWYNTVHLHSAIRFVTPATRHAGHEAAQLRARHTVYARARRRHPERWTRQTRNWTPIHTVRLNPAHNVVVTSLVRVA